MSTFVEQGILTPLTDQVNASKVLSDPNVIPANEWEQVKTKDGQIYGVFTKYQGGTMPIVRKDWLDELNLPEPATLDDYYNVLKAFTEQDPDGNGKKTRTDSARPACMNCRVSSARGLETTICGNGGRQAGRSIFYRCGHPGL